MGFEDERYDMLDSETGRFGMDQLVFPEEIRQCSHCNGPSDGKTEVQEWAGQELHYFCGQGCMDEWFGEWDKANGEIGE
jgi:hypothetical protein